MERLIIYGAGGFGREIACLVNSLNRIENKWELLGFVDDGLAEGTTNEFGKVLGNIDFLNSFPQKIGVALSVASPEIIKRITAAIVNPNVWYPNLVAPDAKIHDLSSFKFGIGNILFFSCRISCNVRIGDFNIINSLSSLGHDVCLGDRNVLNPQVRISGNSSVGDGNFFGVNSIIIQGIKIGNNTRVGVSSVVIRNTQDGHLYFGNPAKRIRP